MSNYLYDSNTLYHHGVLGMKWGHHTATVSSGGHSSRARKIEKQISKYGSASNAAVKEHRNGEKRAKLVKGSVQTAGALVGLGLAFVNPVLSASVATVGVFGGVAAKSYVTKQSDKRVSEILSYEEKKHE